METPTKKCNIIEEPPDSWPRYNKCMQELSGMYNVDESSIQRILNVHDGLVSSHWENIGLGTLYSTVTNLNTIRVWKEIGHPCTNPYIQDNCLREAIR